MSTRTTGTLENALPQKWLPVKAVIIKENRISIDSYESCYKSEDDEPMQSELITWTNAHFVCPTQINGATSDLSWTSILKACQLVSNKPILKAVYSWL